MSDYGYDHLDKLAWAEHHLQAFEDTLRTFKKSEPYRIVNDFDPETREGRASVKLVKPFLLNFGLIVGDIVHSLRSSLDCLTLALSEAHCERNGLTLKEGHIRKIQFPICDAYAGFHDPKRQERLAKVSSQTRGEIEALQPYLRMPGTPNLHPLAILRTLSDTDKHRRIVVTFGRLLGPSTIYDGVDLPPGATLGWRDVALKEGAVFSEWTVPEGMAEPEVKMNAKLPLEIRFGNSPLGNDLPVRATLEAMRDDIRDNVFPTLEPFLQ